MKRNTFLKSLGLLAAGIVSGKNVFGAAKKNNKSKQCLIITDPETGKGLILNGAQIQLEWVGYDNYGKKSMELCPILYMKYAMETTDFQDYGKWYASFLKTDQLSTK